MSDHLRDLVNVMADDRGATVRRLPFAEVQKNPLKFYREYVAGSHPVIITGMLEEWNGSTQWRGSRGGVNGAHLAALMRNKETGEDTSVTVALTPNGWADAITAVEKPPAKARDYFVTPFECSKTLPELCTALHRSHKDCKPVLDADPESRFTVRVSSEGELEGAPRTPIPYAQLQNSSLTVEYRAVLGDIDSNVKDFGEQIFGVAAEAENFWIGSDCSVTSMHQDLYENLYAVVAGGSKTFHLLRPCEAPYLSKIPGRCAEWDVDGDDGDDAKLKFVVKPSEISNDTTPWIKREVTRPCGAPDVEPKVNLVVAECKSGEVLYLPQRWWHRVSHTTDYAGDCSEDEHESVPAVTAINYWFDVKDGPMAHYCDYIDSVHGITDDSMFDIGDTL